MTVVSKSNHSCNRRITGSIESKLIQSRIGGVDAPYYYRIVAPVYKIASTTASLLSTKTALKSVPKFTHFFPTVSEAKLLRRRKTLKCGYCSKCPLGKTSGQGVHLGKKTQGAETHRRNGDLVLTSFEPGRSYLLYTSAERLAHLDRLRDLVEVPVTSDEEVKGQGQLREGATRHALDERLIVHFEEALPSGSRKPYHVPLI